jgi:RNA polymerase-binding transcription factor DksA
MAKKKTTKKTPAKKASKKTATKKKVAKKVIKKKVANKKKAVNKKITKKKAVKKKVAKKKVTKKVIKKVTKKKVVKKSTPKKAATKKSVTKKSVTKKTAESKPATLESPAKKKLNRIESNSSPLKPKAKRRRGMSVSEIARITETDADGFVLINGRRVRMLTTPLGMKKKKRTKKTKVVTADAPSKRTLKTSLTAKELRGYRDRLMKYRASLLIDLSAIENEALSTNADLSSMPIHMADVGSDAYDQDLKLGMAASERKRIRDIEAALMRIKKKTYGVCQLTGVAIPTPRLRAKPWAKYTKESAEKIERQTRRTS